MNTYQRTHRRAQVARTVGRLVVDPILCDGHGLCAELLPELIGVDDWGYPMLRDHDVPAPLERYARRAVAACPVLALRIDDRDTTD